MLFLAKYWGGHGPPGPPFPVAHVLISPKGTRYDYKEFEMIQIINVRGVRKKKEFILFSPNKKFFFSKKGTKF